MKLCFIKLDSYSDQLYTVLKSKSPSYVLLNANVKKQKLKVNICDTLEIRNWLWPTHHILAAIHSSDVITVM